MISGFTGPLAWTPAAGTALTNTTTQTSLLLGGAGAGKWAMPGSFFNSIGQTLRLRAGLSLSSAAATPGTLTLFVVIGAVNVAASPAWTMTTSLSSTTVIIDWILSLRSTGDGVLATFMHTGMVTGAIQSATQFTNPIPTTGPAAGTGFNANAAATLDLQAAFGTVSASNILTLQHYHLESVV